MTEILRGKQARRAGPGGIDPLPRLPPVSGSSATHWCYLSFVVSTRANSCSASSVSNGAIGPTAAWKSHYSLTSGFTQWSTQLSWAPQPYCNMVRHQTGTGHSLWARWPVWSVQMWYATALTNTSLPVAFGMAGQELNNEVDPAISCNSNLCVQWEHTPVFHSEQRTFKRLTKMILIGWFRLASSELELVSSSFNLKCIVWQVSRI